MARFGFLMTTSTPSPREIHALAELRKLRAHVAALEGRLAASQAANEAAYKDAYDSAGGPRFDVGQPFGTPAADGGDA
ncbi:hypothetical protein J7I98_23865 [Streptomyces sp. ISL-98]|uniref:hypothetical protein n=1 Tax=Streptomyces sp. ISL-98 TaxID=2819192 RepID=UPI001BE52FEF|nr:hypothetical protein [Streptomyces sp. ISL-98]MBT2508868.1 hypothetical protein [Streptomyces sp. ISL-98]